MDYIWDEKNCLLAIEGEKQISLHEADIVKFSISPNRIRIGLRLSDYVNPSISSCFLWLNINNWKECTFNYDAEFSKDDWFDDSILSVEKDDTGIKFWMEFMWAIYITSDAYTIKIESANDFSETQPRFEISEALMLKTVANQLNTDNAFFDLPPLVCSILNEASV